MKIYIKFLRSFRRVLEHCFHSFYVDFIDNLAFSFRKVSNINKSVLKFFFLFSKDFVYVCDFKDGTGTFCEISNHYD